MNKWTALGSLWLSPLRRLQVHIATSSMPTLILLLLLSSLVSNLALIRAAKAVAWLLQALRQFLHISPSYFVIPSLALHSLAHPFLSYHASIRVPFISPPFAIWPNANLIFHNDLQTSRLLWKDLFLRLDGLPSNKSSQKWVGKGCYLKAMLCTNRWAKAALHLLWSAFQGSTW